MPLTGFLYFLSEERNGYTDIRRYVKAGTKGVSMELKKAAIAGTMESSDVMITIRPDPGNGIHIDLKSDVKALFGDAIEATVREVLAEFDVTDADISIVDKGALDFAIRARAQCAVCRAAEVNFDWSKEDCHG